MSDYDYDGKLDGRPRHFDGGYGRQGDIAILRDSVCDVCGRGPVRVLYVDGSEGEYSGGHICRECCVDLFDWGTA
jgi:hypothetical protein